jgi:hypothetical protein
LVKTCKLCEIEVTRGADNRNTEHLRTPLHAVRAEKLYCGLVCKNKLMATRRGVCALASTGLTHDEHKVRAFAMRSWRRGSAPPDRRVTTVGDRMYCRTCLLRVDRDALAHLVQLANAAAARTARGRVSKRAASPPPATASSKRRRSSEPLVTNYDNILSHLPATVADERANASHDEYVEYARRA